MHFLRIICSIRADAFRAFGKRRITVLGKLLVCGNVAQGFSHESFDSVMIRLMIAFVFK